MKRLQRPALLLLLLLAALVALPVTVQAESLELGRRFAVGDTYVLSLSTTTEMDVQAVRGDGEPTREDVRIDYRATVDVLEVDARGRPTRERHRDVSLEHARPGDDFGSMFRQGSNFQVQRSAEGGIGIYVAGRRVDPAVERPVVEMLRTWFDLTPGPVLLDPGREVTAGDSWDLDPDLAEKFVRSQGIQATHVRDPSAALTRDTETGLLKLSFHIPVAAFVVRDLHEGTRTADSKAFVSGRLYIGEDGRPMSYVQDVSQEMHGHSGDPTTPNHVAWSLERSQRSVQRTELLGANPASSGAN